MKKKSKHNTNANTSPGIAIAGDSYIKYAKKYKIPLTYIDYSKKTKKRKYKTLRMLSDDIHTYEETYLPDNPLLTSYVFV